MRIFIVLLLAAAPASAQEMWMQGIPPDPAGAHFATVAYGLLAALGYWVLRHAAKDAPAYVKRAGQAVGWFLAVIGLLGVLCGVSMHIRNGLGCNTCGVSDWDEAYEEEMYDEQEPGEGGGRTIRVKVIKEGPGSK